MEYKINIESPEDFEKVYDLYETIAKSKGAGKAEKAETLGTVTKKATPTTSAIDTRGSFSDIAQKSYATRFGS